MEGAGAQVLDTQPRSVEVEDGLAVEAHTPPVEGEVERALGGPAAAAEGKVESALISQPPPVEGANERSP